MDNLFATLKQQQESLVGRSTAIAERTRARSRDVLLKVQHGALDWQRTLSARHEELRHEEPRWFRFVSLRAGILVRADELLARFVRELRMRAIGLELPKKGSRTSKKKPAPKAKAKAKNGSRRLVLPVADYESRSARDLVAEIPRLSAAQCQAILEHERSHKKRKSVLAALESRLPS